jgi:transcriptional regulator with XRE-family HTH domain
VVASGPAGPRRRLGAELRRLRNGAGLHLDQVAERLHCSTSKISRLETGKGVAKPADVRELIAIYGVAAETEREMLMRLVRESRTEGWWTSYTDGVAPERFFLDAPGRYAALEADAVGVRAFDLTVINGLLQTAEYAHAVLSVELPHHSPQEIDLLVELRRRRQEALRRAAPLRLSVVVDEAALVRVVGGRDVMAAQLGHLLDVVQLSNVDVRVLSFDDGLSRAHLGAFSILEIPDDLGSGVVYVEGPAGETFLEADSDLQLYLDVFDEAVGRSLDADRSREAVRRWLHHHAPRERAPQ